MSEVHAPRARLVELLWQLKQTYDKYGDGGVRYVHFSTLLKDSHYRDELINQAVHSANPEISTLGQRIRQLNIDGELAQAPANCDAQRAVNPDIAETLSASSHRKSLVSSRSRPLYIGVGLFLVFALLGGLFYSSLFTGDSDRESISGSLYGQHTWKAHKTWVLDGIVYVEAGAELTIEAGTTVLGHPGSALVVTRGARILARGRRSAPVVFSSAKKVGQRKAGDWGGLVMLGAAPVNAKYAQIEGIPVSDSRGAFGGFDAEDSCGVLEFVRIEYAGFEVYANNELNGLTLGGCGSNTIVRNVQIHRSLDDGLEIFGGDVDLKNVLITGAGDDSLDWDMGWQGRVQHLLVLQYPDRGDNAIEADNLQGDHLAQPRSEPILYNVSLLSLSSQEKIQRAMTLRRGTGGHFNNMLISGFSGEAVDIKDAATSANLVSGNLSFSALSISNIGVGGNAYFTAEYGDTDDDSGLDELAYFGRRGQLRREPFWLANPEHPEGIRFNIPENSPLTQGVHPIPEGEFWDEAANYRGAVRPGSAGHWFDGWSAFSVN
jgi:hypothetical protein